MRILGQLKVIEMPFKQSVYNGGPPKNKAKYLHRLTVEDFDFNAFDKQELYLDANLKSLGDQKVE